MSCPSVLSSRVGTVGALGFRGTSCCRVPCPGAPPVHVVVCVNVNRTSMVKFELGCFVGRTDVEQTCIVDYRPGETFTSNGKQCRTVQYNHLIPANSFLRITFCPVDGACSNAGCGVSDYNAGASTSVNSILSFKIDGVDIYGNLEALTTGEVHTQGCVSVGCVAGSGCCTIDDTFTTLAEIPWGAQVVVGPIGTILFS